MFDAILNRAPAPAASVNPELPAELDHIISKALEKDRDLRYQSAAELRADLKRARRDTEPVRSAARTGLPPAASLPSGTEAGRSRHARGVPWRRGLLLSTGALLAVAAVFGYLLTRPLPVPKVSNYVQLTHDGEPKQLVGTDGARLFFRLGDRTRWSIDEVSVSGGEPVRIQAPSETMDPGHRTDDTSRPSASTRRASLFSTYALKNGPTF